MKLQKKIIAIKVSILVVNKFQVHKSQNINEKRVKG